MSILLDPLLYASLATAALALWLRLGSVPHLLASALLLAWGAWRAVGGERAEADGPVSLALWTLATAAVIMGIEAALPAQVARAPRVQVRLLPHLRRAGRATRRGAVLALRGLARGATVLSAGAAALSVGASRLAEKLHEAEGDSRRVEHVERVEGDGTLFAIIIRASYREPGVNFVTPPESQFQVGVLTHPLGRVIKAHVHKTRPQQVNGTPEVLLLREGKVRTDFYMPDGRYVTSKTLHAGDTLLLLDGGHGFEVLEPCVMIEVKQGPYRGVAEDKRLLDDKPSD